jgi:MFS family permease
MSEQDSLPRDSLPSGPVAQAARRVGTERLVVASCVFGLIAMALMCWSVLDPTPFPVLVAMSVGQAVGTASLLCYLGAIFVEAWRLRQRAKR